ncbi:hypothetical protein [Mesorhizobium sp. M0578]|uniref:hypothetical protein n=1 Tax=unclassified Mesorhizobium TaxID=325217 RepID=UPI00333B7985
MNLKKRSRRHAKAVRSNAQPEARGEPHVLLEEPKPIPADEQIEWAASYVEDRLDAALEQLQASLETLDFIVEATIERQDPQGLPTQPSGKTDQVVTLVLLDLEGDRKSTRDDVAGARDDFTTLHAALAEWTARASGQATT